MWTTNGSDILSGIVFLSLATLVHRLIWAYMGWQHTNLLCWWGV